MGQTTKWVSQPLITCIFFQISVYLSFQMEEMKIVLNKEDSKSSSSLSDKGMEAFCRRFVVCKACFQIRDLFFVVVIHTVHTIQAVRNIIRFSLDKITLQEAKAKPIPSVVMSGNISSGKCVGALPNLVIRHIPKYCFVEKLTTFLELEIV